MTITGTAAACWPPWRAALPPPPAIGAPRTPLFKRINKPLGIQLYTLGEAAQKDMAGTLTRLAATGYKDFELPGLYGRSAKDLRAEGDKAGVRFSSHPHGPAPALPPAR
jgi:hypothetical protein